MNFSDIVGQESIKEQLQGAISTGRVSHAYILYGEVRSGKEFVAKVFAQSLLCEKPVTKPDGTIEPCGECHSCRQAMTANHPDIIYVPSTIGVEEIRDRIVETVQVKPYQGPYKIYIVEEAEKLTVQAQNVLLKTIEEPPAYVVFMLLTSSTEALLPTILSRCVLLNMRPVRDDEMRTYLIEQLHVPESRAEICIAFARGNIGRAKALAASEDFDKIRTNALSLLKNIHEMDTADIMEALKNIREYGFDINDYLDIMAVWYRDILLFKATHDMNHLIFRDEIQSIQKVAQCSDYEGIEEVIQALEVAKSRLRSKVNYELTMELLLLTIKEN
ncbi:MAG: DNA polymerase III subunit delta' [Lachnospiraceae bacterium]|nr:DNA polymerase III subunit delta' [Lachnospiraceae bacterium]MBR6155426.1 DNA polymerase III subunit delta' [Lachnospiraceae bacterium]